MCTPVIFSYTITEGIITITVQLFYCILEFTQKYCGPLAVEQVEMEKGVEKREINWNKMKNET